jgi:glucokinase
MGNGKKRFWIGFDLGGTKMMAKVYTDELKAVGERRRKTKPQDGVEAGLERVRDTIREALSEAKVGREELAGIGIGCPGPLDLDKGVLIDAPNLGWRKVKLREHLEGAFRVPVVICNDVDAGVFGEYTLGAGRKMRCVFGIFPGTGIGGGCVYEGRLLRGRKHSCLEVGHMQMVPNGALCGCGRRGCLETLASRLAIASACAAAAYRGEAPYLLKTAGMDLENIRSGMLADAVRAGDKAVERIVRDAARWLGVGIANVVNLLAPDAVILGGGLVEAMPSLFKDEVESSVNEHVMPSFREVYKVYLAVLGDDATAAGAAAWARESVLNDQGKD